MILLLSSAVMLTPLLTLMSHPEEADHAWAFGLPAACLFFLGIALWKAFRSSHGITLTVQEGGIIVLASWIIVILLFRMAVYIRFGPSVFPGPV